MRALSARTAQELLEEPIDEADWIIEDVLSVGAHILAGAPKVDKSWMVLAMGPALSMGQPFWDCTVCQRSSPPLLGRHLCAREEKVLEAHRRSKQ